MFTNALILTAVMSYHVLFAFILSIMLLALVALLLLVRLRRQRKTMALLAADNENIIAEIERLKEELYDIRNKAGESDRLKSAFLCNMSHELRTPLHAIMGFAGLIANPAGDDEEKVMYANIINRNVDSLLEIINDIFDISQAEAGVNKVMKEPLNVHDMLNSLQTWLNLEKATAGKPDIVVKVSKAAKDNNFVINTDAYKLRRAMNHLADNALKYTNDGYIELGYQFGAENTIDFFVKDDGIGFASDKLDVIFTRFRQVDETPTRQFQGLGLGLAVAQKFTALLNGKLWAESEPGQGATFWISLPLGDKPD